MDTEAALRFLELHQPLPDDASLGEALGRKYREILRYFIDNPDPRCIPLLLQSFGEGDGSGAYPLVDETLRGFVTSAVVPHLLKGLRSPRRSIRFWNARIAASFPSADLIPALAEVLQRGDVGLRTEAAAALGKIHDQTAKEALRRAYFVERDPALRKSIARLLG